MNKKLVSVMAGLRGSLLLLTVLMGSVAQAQQTQETLIRNATVITVTRGTLENTDVLLRNGKIAAIGKNLNASSSARVIDGTGKYVMPGIMNLHADFGRPDPG